MNRYSFIIPTLNAADTLTACIEHLRALKWKSDRIEVIVVDNGSTDNSLSIAESLADSTLVDEKASIARLRNLGAEQSSANIIVFVDSDCLLQSNWIEIADQYFANSDVAMVGSKTHILPKDASWVAKAWKIHLDRSGKEPNPTWLVTRALAIRKSVFVDVGGFDETLETCEDVALGHAVSRGNRIVGDNLLAPVHLKDASTLSELFRKEVWRGKDSIKTSLKYFFQSKGNGFSLKELISFALPTYYLVAFTVFLFSLIPLANGIIYPVVFATSLILIPILILAYDTASRTNNFTSIPQLFTVYAVYIAARTSALLR